MRVDAFDFDLPEGLIALRPAEPRESAKLLHIPKAGDFRDLTVADLPAFLRPGDALVINDTKVIPAQLTALRRREGASDVSISLTLHKRLGPERWAAFVKGARKIRAGDHLVFGSENDTCMAGSLTGQVETREEMEAVIAFDRSGPALDEAIRLIGRTPLPPYIASQRPEDEQDRKDYQTIYATHDGSVAAPTAGLHLTPALLEAITARGVSLHRVTLHVGAGTFLPVKADDTEEHSMHAEWGEVSAATADALNAVKARGGRVIAVGTTSLRLLECAAASGMLKAFCDETAIFITPGYQFRIVDALMTNFHLPRSTLFMLVCAFCGYDRMTAAYAHAIAQRYRFYSYGDASFLERPL